MRTESWLKKVLLGTAILFIFTASSAAWADVYVNGYYRGNGTYVQPHWRSDPDGNPSNNWSYPGNVNPYTGRVAPGRPSTYLRDHDYSPGISGFSGFGSPFEGSDDDE